MILLVGFLQCAAVGWMYGATRFQANWKTMQGCCCCPLPLIFWSVITPLLLFAMLICTFVNYALGYDIQSISIPVSSFLLAFLVVLISAIVLFATRTGSARQKWRAVTQPWGLTGRQLRAHDRPYEAVPMYPRA